MIPQTNVTVQKFGNQKATISDVGLGAHEGKYTPSASVPNLATRLVIDRERNKFGVFLIANCNEYF